MGVRWSCGWMVGKDGSSPGTSLILAPFPESLEQSWTAWIYATSLGDTDSSSLIRVAVTFSGAKEIISHCLGLNHSQLETSSDCTIYKSQPCSGIPLVILLMAAQLGSLLIDMGTQSVPNFWHSSGITSHSLPCLLTASLDKTACGPKWVIAHDLICIDLI